MTGDTICQKCGMRFEAWKVYGYACSREGHCGPMMTEGMAAPWFGSLPPQDLQLQPPVGYVRREDYEATHAARIAAEAERDEWKAAATQRHADPQDFRYWEGRYRDEKAMREAAEAREREATALLRKCHAFSTDRTGPLFQAIDAFLAGSPAPRDVAGEAALTELARLGQEFDAAPDADYQRKLSQMQEDFPNGLGDA